MTKENHRISSSWLSLYRAAVRKQRISGSCSMKSVLLSVVLLILMISFTSSMVVGRRGIWGQRVANLTRQFASSSVSANSKAAAVVHHPSYERLEDFTLPEYGLSGSIYSHRKSGAQVISVVAPDDNKVFGITFRTPPKDR